MRTSLSIIFLLAATLPGFCLKAAEPDDHPAADWLEQAAIYGNKIVLDREPEPETSIEWAELYATLTICEAWIGRSDRASSNYGLTIVAMNLIIHEDGGFPNAALDPWFIAYSPGPALAAKEDSLIDAFPDKMAQYHLEALQYVALAHLSRKDEQAYKQTIEKAVSLLAPAQRSHINKAREDEWPYDGTFTAWYFMKMFRDYGDLDSARQFGAFHWEDPCERAGTLAVLAQMEWVAGNKEAAAQVLEQATEAMQNATNQSKADIVKLPVNTPEDELWGQAYMPDLATHLPELYAAVLLINGKEAAEAISKSHERTDTLWRIPAYIHAATMSRRAGELRQAKQLLDNAMDVPMVANDLPSSFDIMHLCRELANQGRIENVRAFIDEMQRNTFKAYGCLGVGQALITDDHP